LLNKLKTIVSDAFSAGSESPNINGTLSITISGGNQLDIARDESYCIVKIGETEHKTSIKPGSNPKWDETLNFPLKNVDQKENVHITVLGGLDYEIGSCTISLSELACHRGKHSYQLTKEGLARGALLISCDFDGSGWPALGVAGQQWSSQEYHKQKHQQEQQHQQPMVCEGDDSKKQEYHQEPRGQPICGKPYQGGGEDGEQGAGGYPQQQDGSHYYPTQPEQGQPYQKNETEYHFCK